MMSKVGIYMIRNRKNNKVYVGCSNNIRKRWYDHKTDLNKNEHGNEHLQRSWNKYGEDSFEFTVLTECNTEELEDFEQYWMDRLDSFEIGYNQREEAGVNIKGEKHPAYQGGKTEFECEYCGSLFEKYDRERDKNKFCSRSCHMKDRHSKNEKDYINSKNLNEQDVKEIKKLLNRSDKTQKEIAKDFSVSTSAISRINIGDSWEWVEVE